MGFLGFLLLGLVAGALARLILPGRQGGGWIVTLVLGVAGALLGGWLASRLFDIDVNRSPFDPLTLVIAVSGSLVLLVVWGLVAGRQGGRR